MSKNFEATQLRITASHIISDVFGSSRARCAFNEKRTAGRRLKFTGVRQSVLSLSTLKETKRKLDEAYPHTQVAIFYSEHFCKTPFGRVPGLTLYIAYQGNDIPANVLKAQERTFAAFGHVEGTTQPALTEQEKEVLEKFNSSKTKLTKMSEIIDMSKDVFNEDIIDEMRCERNGLVNAWKNVGINIRG